MRRHLLITLIAAAFLISPRPVASAEPADYRSQRLMLHTDVPAEQAKALLAELEKELDYLARYWKRTQRGVIECFLVADVANWPEAKLQPGRRAIDAGSGITLSSTLRSGGRFTTRATVYASAKGTSIKHEIVHAYCRQTFSEVGPKWYSEGMAEIGQYWRPDDTGVNCEASNVRYLRYGTRDIRPGRLSPAEPRPLEDILGIQRGSAENYAWSWSLCHLMAHNSNYQDRFRAFGINLLTKKRVDFRKVFAKDLERIEFERRLFLRDLERGYRVDLCAWDWETQFAPPLSNKTREMEVHAARGWQATGLLVKPGERIRYKAAGGWRVAKSARAVSAEGESGGRGRLVGVLMNEYRLSEPFDLGRQGTYTARGDGKLFVRCRDHWHELADNDGSITLTLPQSEEASSSVAKTKRPVPKTKPATKLDDEKRAAGKLRLAKLLLKRKPATGKQRLREIVQQYPGTKAAKEAQALLER